MTALRVVIVGASLAGVQTALALRTERFDGEIVLIGSEEHAPYDRPGLSKEYLCQPDTTIDNLRLLDPLTARERGIDLRLGATAVELDRRRRTVVLADGREFGFDVCVIATGASARSAPWPGTHVLRTADDASALRRELLPGRRVAVIGAGFVGAEVASSARSRGCEVTVVDTAHTPLLRALGPDVGALLASLPDRMDVTYRLGTAIDTIQHDSRGATLRLGDGSTVTADVVVAGIGATPNEQWLAASGLTVADGVHCDTHCRALESDDIYAAGDVARWWHAGYQQWLRLEHWTNATQQAQVVAYNITHPERPREYRAIEYVWSDQYGVKLQLTGRFSSVETFEIIGGVDWSAPCPRTAIICADADRNLAACATVNWPKAAVQARRLLESGTDYRTAVDVLRATVPATPAVFR